MDKPIPEAALLPCPMCGGDAALNICRTTEREFIRLNGRDTGYGVNCVTCGLKNRGFAYGYATPAEAITAWNRRTLTVAQQQGQAAPPSAPVGVDDGINVPAAKALITIVGPGFKVIYRDTFRWKDASGDVLPNHYEMFSAETLARDFGYDLVLDLGYAAILRDPSALAQQPAAVDELPDCPHSALDGCDCYATPEPGATNDRRD